MSICCRIDISILIHYAQENNVLAAIAKIDGLSTVMGTITKIRMEELG